MGEGARLPLLVVDLKALENLQQQIDHSGLRPANSCTKA